MASPADVAAADAFLSDEKSLFGAPPEFGPSQFFKKSVPENCVIWPIEGSNRLVESGQLRIIARSFDLFSISLIFKSQSISRLDFDYAGECHANPHWAHVVRAPPLVCGPHFHGWRENRSYLLSSDRWHLPVRTPLPPQVRRFEQAFAWMAQNVNLVLSHDQRTFSLPATLV